MKTNIAKGEANKDTENAGDDWRRRLFPRKQRREDRGRRTATCGRRRRRRKWRRKWKRKWKRKTTTTKNDAGRAGADVTALAPRNE